MKSISRQIVSVILVFVFAFSGAQGKIVETNLSKEKRLAVFDEVWQTINERYYDANLRGIDWNARKISFRRRVEEAENQTKFYELLRAMIGELRDSHTRIYAADEKFPWRAPRVVSIGVSVREIENELIVIKVEKDSEAEKAGVRVGDVLTSVDDASAKSLFNKKITEGGASTEAAVTLKAAATLFSGSVNSTVKISWRDEKGRERFANLHRSWRNVKDAARVRRQKNVLIIGFDVFTNEIASEVFQNLRANSHNLRAVILDLRTNRGGDAEAMIDVASVFLPSATDLGTFVDRQGKVSVFAQTRTTPFFTANFIKMPETPLVVLTGSATASAAEIFVAAMKKANRARIIGTPTCGCVLGVTRQYSLPDGGALEISELDFKLPDGTRLEGVGIAPDEVIRTEKRDLRARRDKALEKSLIALTKF